MKWNDCSYFMNLLFLVLLFQKRARFMLTEEVSNKTKSTISPPESRPRDQLRLRDWGLRLGWRGPRRGRVANICRISPRSDSRQTFKIIGFKYFKCDDVFFLPLLRKSVQNEKNIRSLHAITMNQLEQLQLRCPIVQFTIIEFFTFVLCCLQCNKLRCHLKILESPLKFGDLFHQVIRRRQGETKIRLCWLINGDSRQSGGGENHRMCVQYVWYKLDFKY